MAKPKPLDNAGLTSAQLKALRARLDEARAEALGALKKAEAVAQSAEPESEPMDAAELAREQGDGALFVERMRERLVDVEDALRKMDEGAYGLSERSGQPIDPDRLLVVPWARLTADEE